jgi:S1-C subfamily serine protease
MKNIGRLIKVGVFSFLVGCFVSPSSVPEVNPAVPYDSERYKRIEEEKKKTVALVIEGDDALFAYCAGIWVKNGMILTANHCVEDLNTLVLYAVEEDFKTKKARMSMIASIDEDNDLALLFVDPSSEPPHENVDMTKDPKINIGQDVDIIGHAAGYPWSYARGQISAVRIKVEGPDKIRPDKVVQVSAPVWMGNSGGGVFDGNGNFIGLCSWISRRGPFISFFIHKEAIEKFLFDKEVPL